MNILAGRLREVITIQKESIVKSDFGGETVTYVDRYTNIRAGVTIVSGKDGLTADQYYGKTIKKFTIRYLPDISTKDIIVFDSEEYDIVPPINKVMERGNMIILTAEKRAK